MENERSWLPSPKRSVLLLLLVIGIIFVATIIDKREPKKETGYLRIASNDGSAIDIALTDIDSDGDGLRDWEEALWGTDPENIDSDGDGTQDGDEVDIGRNPSIPAPNDSFSLSPVNPPIISNTNSSTTQENRTNTEIFSEIFITTYINNKIAGGSFTDQVDEFTKLAIIPSTPPAKYKIEDLTIIKNASKNQIHNYGNSISALLKKNAPNVSNELILILEAIRDGNEDSIKILDITALSYSTSAQDLLAIPVPQTATAVHIDLINSLLSVSHDINNMKLLFEDPLSSLTSFDSYFATSSELINALRSVGQYLKNETSFAPNEDGYVLTSNL